MAENQNEVREKLNKYLEQTGVKAKFVASKINLDETVLSRFRSGKKTLYLGDLKLLDEYLSSLNYYCEQ